MDLPQQFVLLSYTLRNVLNEINDNNKMKVSSLIDELDSFPYNEKTFVRRHVAIPLVTTLCLQIKPNDKLLAVKASHLINSVLTKQTILFGTYHHSDLLLGVISWYVDCLRQSPDTILPDVLQDMQGILLSVPAASFMCAEDLIGNHGILIDMIDVDKGRMLCTDNPLQTCLTALKCILSVVSTSKHYMDKAGVDDLAPEVKENISGTVVKLLIKLKIIDEFLYSKVVIAGLRVLFQLYFRDKNLSIPLPAVMGICRHFILYGLVNNSNELEAIAGTTLTHNFGEEFVRKHMETAKHVLECLGNETLVSNFSPRIIDDIDNIDNLVQEALNSFVSSDTQMTDVEKNKKAELIAVKSKVRVSASKLLLLMIKLHERDNILSNWWAHLPCSPVSNMTAEESAKKTLAFCVKYDPLTSSRVNVFKVVVALFHETIKENMRRVNEKNTETTMEIPDT